MDSNLYRFILAVDWLCVYYSFLVLLMGCVCNPLSFAVLSRRAFRGSTISLYFRFLCLMDLGAILTGLVRFVQISVFGYDNRVDSLTCKLSVWLGDTFFSSSSWTLVAITTERAISIAWPHQVRVTCTAVKARFVIVVIFFVMVCIYMPMFFVRDRLEIFNIANNTTQVIYCTIVYNREFLNLFYFFLDGSVFAYVPCTLLIVFNVIIILNVVKSRHRVSKFRAPNLSSVENSRGKTEKKKKDSKRESSLTLTLIAINVMFIVCNAPICLFLLCPHFQSSEGMSPVGDAITRLLFLLMTTNNAANFLLYCATGSRFRKEALSLVKELLQRFSRAEDSPQLINKNVK